MRACAGDLVMLQWPQVRFLEFPAMLTPAALRALAPGASVAVLVDGCPLSDRFGAASTVAVVVSVGPRWVRVRSAVQGQFRVAVDGSGRLGLTAV